MDQAQEKILMSAADIHRALMRMAHEVLERNHGVYEVVLAGIHTRGVPLAQRLARYINRFEGCEVPIIALDVWPYRDDLSYRSPRNVAPPEIPVTIAGKKVVLVDDVLFTGRTVRAAMDGLVDLGRPTRIQLAILVDRGHREVPIRADYVGKNLPTSLEEQVRVRLVETDDTDEVAVVKRPARRNHLSGQPSSEIGLRH